MFTGSTKNQSHTRAVGNITEDIAYQHLIKNGLILITKNFSHKIGEIDLIMKSKNTLVFIEVRYRKNSTYGFPEETVTFNKQKKIKSTALIFISQNQKYRNFQPRFDVVALMPDSNNEIAINWIQNAF